MFAVISDVHSNLEALTVVLDDIEKRGIKTIYCLGDVIGYGNYPSECITLMLDKKISSVKGNHEAAIFDEKLYSFCNI